ncbi:scabin-related ADP-ribosyltransferase [Fastidiosibacter lacustris]|uniref:scabin-related ADP-ribosyltransferase n=1 Tax=Fastidiosibacter lacustris TaxID=2056695 RepID=UPI000E34AAF9|nr:polymorphic toxin-type HINT domain-containing protein [Fastidiosibacter lacustris]
MKILNFAKCHKNYLYIGIQLIIKKLIVNIMGLISLLSISYALNLNSPSYDLESITPETWQQVNLSYSDIINGKKYPAEIKLLRPITWLKEQGMDKLGNQVNLSIPEFGVDRVEVKVTEINPTSIDTSSLDWQKQNSRPVISTFKRYAEDVRTYKFKDDQGNIEKINATPNHPFYVKNKGKFIEIDKVLSSDKLVRQLGKAVSLVCPVGKTVSCGEQYNKDGKPVVVYNMEVYREHVYFAGEGSVLVHNVCGELMSDGERGFFAQEILKSKYYNDHIGYRNLVSQAEKRIREVTKKYTSPKYIYRLDDRPPSDIFKEGFIARDKNSNVSLNDYVADGKAASKYVSTTSNSNYIVDSFKARNPGSNSYLYKIKNDHQGIYIPYSKEVNIENRLAYISQSEYTYINQIPSNIIVSAARI